MDRVLKYFNLLGVCALAVLCGFQWQANGRATTAAVAAERARAEAVAALAERDHTLASQSAELDDARGRLAAAQASLADVRARLTAATAERDQLTVQRTQYRSTVDRWSSAVADRDAALKRLTADRDAAVRRFNDLVGKYNALVVAVR